MIADRTDRDVREQVGVSLQGWGRDYLVEEIVREIIGTYGLVDIDTIDPDEYWAIVDRHDRERAGAQTATNNQPGV